MTRTFHFARKFVQHALSIAALSSLLVVLLSNAPLADGTDSAGGANSKETQEMTSSTLFAIRPMIRNIQISPDGRHLAFMTLLSRDSKYAIKIIDTVKMEVLPLVGTTRIDIQRFAWGNDERLLVWTAQDVDTGGGGPSRNYQMYSVAIKKQKWLKLPRRTGVANSAAEEYKKTFLSPSLVSMLPQDEDVILATWNESLKQSSNIYKINIKTGRAKRVLKASGRYLSYNVDWDGDVRLRVRFNDAKDRMEYSARLKGSKDWRDLFSWNVGDRQSIDPLSFSKDDPDILYVSSSSGGEYSKIYEYDLRTTSLGKEVFGPAEADARDLVFEARGKDAGRILGYRYATDRVHTVFTDKKLAAVQAAIDEVLPNRRNDIVSHSDDWKNIVIRSSTPQDSGSYHLLKDMSQLVAIGRLHPLRKPEQMANAEFFRYSARDGLSIPAFLTTPAKGEAPYPTIVMPHGGPWARDYLGHDTWAQLLAYQGYAVLQPQFRGSTGFGMELWKAGDGEWGQKMQDDLEDGMKHLVDQGIANPDRLAIFGWSYGGYAAMMGAIRSPNIFQCAVAGAGVSDINYMRRQTNRSVLRDLQYPTIGGISPIEHVDEVNIPILLVHGDRDIVVPISESQRFARKLASKKKEHQWLKIKDLGHTSNTFRHQHNEIFYAKLVDWFANDCGPEGL